jgi:hypothetical protein
VEKVGPVSVRQLQVSIRSASRPVAYASGEHTFRTTGCSAHIALVLPGGQKLAVEVDGPPNFTAMSRLAQRRDKSAQAA